ncbi:TatD family deoxyribonuclease [Aliikangiella marina]|uniref:TatD family deoxyribonuclease n=1 Tax=Aliikangiella marina TaxID=1712262 RepID=A0A545TJM3_9GAMM|nr:TatD family hydrolase [Aliikangiella marina]TQV77429.1 TatD family deoxyribonuclease [Aliikangiella marina]
MLVDSHCHLDRLDLSPFDGSLDAALQAAREVGVNQFLCVAINVDNQADVLNIASQHEDVYASVGIHPLYTKGQQVDKTYLVEQAQHEKIVAIGETGLDYYYAQESKEEQLALFETHVIAAVESQKPLIIHTRDAREDTLKILADNQADKVGGVLHCFTESLEMALAAIEMGFYISFSGIVTFRNAAELREVAKVLPSDKILVETDSPYLTPVPFRGKPNSPRHVLDVAKCIAEIRDVSLQTIAQQTTDNFAQLFLK